MESVVLSARCKVRLPTYYKCAVTRRLSSMLTPFDTVQVFHSHFLIYNGENAEPRAWVKHIFYDSKHAISAGEMHWLPAPQEIGFCG